MKNKFKKTKILDQKSNTRLWNERNPYRNYVISPIKQPLNDVQDNQI